MDSPFYYLFAVLLFLAVVLLVEGAYLWWNDSKGPEAKRIERRLRVMSAGGHEAGNRQSILKQRMLAESPWLQRRLLQLPRIHQLDRLLEQSGKPWSAAQFIGLSLATAVLVFVVGSILSWPVAVTLAVAVTAALVPWLIAITGKNKRLQQIDLQLPDALDLMGRALRAGHAFPSGLKMVADEMPEPVSGEFGITFDEVNYGIGMKDALLNLASRVPSRDLSYFVIAVVIQRETGGNLAELLDKIAALIRARHKLLGQIRVLSAEGRLSAWILCLLPFALATVIMIINPRFMRVLWTDPIGPMLIAGAVVLMLVGILWSRNIIRIRI
jgi:tight adherence protein B